MRRERPTVVLVFAILSMVFGGLEFLCYLCSGVQAAVQQGAAGVGPAADMREYLVKEVPGYTVCSIGSIGLGLLLSLAAVIAGLGLLTMQRWARWLCLGVGSLLVVAALAQWVFWFAYVWPAMHQWELRQPPGELPASVLGVFQALVWGLFEIGYGIALLIVIFLPHVVAAFAGRRPARRGEETDDVDWDDEGDFEEHRFREDGDA